MPKEVMPREYWTTFSVELADNSTLREVGQPVVEHGLGFGSRVSFARTDGTWLSDEEIDKMAANDAKFMAKYMKEMRDREIERARIAAAPFWARWLGA